jgi:hypothetical protein
MQRPLKLLIFPTTKPIMTKSGILEFVKRSFWFFFFSGIIIAGCIMIENQGPDSTSYQDGDWDYTVLPDDNDPTKWNVLADFHSHTLYSDGKLTVEQNFQWHISNGFNVFVITDHNTWKHIPEVKTVAANYPKVIVFPGSEWTTNIIHMNIILPLNATGYEHIVPPNSNPTLAQIEKAIDDTHAIGGLVSINHINWSVARMPDHPNRTQLFDMGADFIEINGGTWDQASVDFTNSNNMSILTGTDMHSPRGVNGWTGYWTDAFTADAVWEQIKSKNGTTIFQQSSSSYLAKHGPSTAYSALEPIIIVAEMLQVYDNHDGTFNYGGIAIFAAYLYGIFIVAELIRFSRKRFWDKIHSKQNKNDEKTEDLPKSESE